MKLASLTVVNRSIEKAEALQNDFSHIQISKFDNLQGIFDLIINATSASLSGNALVVPAAIMAQKPLCYDLAYNRHEETPFVHYARSHGCKAVDGLGMLVEQAAEAFFIWNGVMPSTEPVLQLL
jgi:shikimate dehydrogenase